MKINVVSLIKKELLVLVGFVSSLNVYAASTIAKVENLNVGGNGKHGTFISLLNKEFSECTVDATTVKAVYMNGDLSVNPNYKEQLSAVLAAKMADKEIIVVYSGCDGAYPVVQEITIP